MPSHFFGPGVLGSREKRLCFHRLAGDVNLLPRTMRTSNRGHHVLFRPPLVRTYCERSQRFAKRLRYPLKQRIGNQHRPATEDYRRREIILRNECLCGC